MPWTHCYSNLQKILFEFSFGVNQFNKAILVPGLGTDHCKNPPKFQNRWGLCALSLHDPLRLSSNSQARFSSLHWGYFCQNNTVWQRAFFLALKASDITETAHIHTVNSLPLQNSVASSIQPIVTNPRTHLSFACSKTHPSNCGSN